MQHHAYRLRKKKLPEPGPPPSPPASWGLPSHLLQPLLPGSLGSVPESQDTGPNYLPLPLPLLLNRDSHLQLQSPPQPQRTRPPGSVGTEDSGPTVGWRAMLL